jgi:putative aminopeptidase
VPGVIANKSHHATSPDEKYRVLKAPELASTPATSKAAVEAAGVRIGTPVVYRPNVVELAGGRIAGTSVDDRAGCAVLVEVARALKARTAVRRCIWSFSVQEEFNLRGAVVAAQALKPDIAIQIDLMLACDTPDMADRGEMRAGRRPGHLALFLPRARHAERCHPASGAGAADGGERPRPRACPAAQCAGTGVLTDLSYVQLLGEGVASIDLGFPCRYTHSSLEVCDPGDLDALPRLLAAGLGRIGPGFDMTTDAP